MKKIYGLFAALALAAMLFSGCTKEGFRRFEGNYSFNTGGTLTLSSADTTFTVEVPTESGQMDIVTTDKSRGNMILTFRPMLGGVVVQDAVANGMTLTLRPVERVLDLSWDGVILTHNGTANVSVEGYGERYNDVIIFRLDYTGTCTAADGTVYNINESNVDCVAKEND